MLRNKILFVLLILLKLLITVLLVLSLGLVQTVPLVLLAIQLGLLSSISSPFNPVLFPFLILPAAALALFGYYLSLFRFRDITEWIIAFGPQEPDDLSD